MNAPEFKPRENFTHPSITATQDNAASMRSIGSLCGFGDSLAIRPRTDIRAQLNPNAQEFKPRENLTCPSSISNGNTLGLYKHGTSTSNGNCAERLSTRMTNTSMRSIGSLCCFGDSLAIRQRSDINENSNNIASSSQNENYQNNSVEGVANNIICYMNHLMKHRSLSQLINMIPRRNNQPEISDTVATPPNYTNTYTGVMPEGRSHVTTSPSNAVGGPAKLPYTGSSDGSKVCDTCKCSHSVINCPQCNNDVCRQCLSSEKHIHNVLSVRPTLHDEKCSEHPKYPALFICKNHNRDICIICKINLLGIHSNCSTQINVKTNENKDETRYKYILPIENLVSKTNHLFNRFIPNPLQYDNAYKHLLFNCRISPTDIRPMSNAARKLQVAINDLLCSCNYTTGSRIKQCINKVQTSFRSFKEYTTANQIPTRRVRVFGINVPHLQNCRLVGPGTKVAVVNQEGTLYLEVKNINGEPCKYGEFRYDVVATEHHVNGQMLPMIMKAHFQEGVIEIRYKFSNRGTHFISATVNRQQVPNTPLSIFVDQDSKFERRMEFIGYDRLNAPIISPRAFITDKDDNIYVADECRKVMHKVTQNNEASIIFEFLNIPSAIAVDNIGDIAICDPKLNCVTVYNNNGLIKKSSLVFHGIKCPSAIVVDSRNRFVIIHSKSKLIRLSNNMMESEEMFLHIDSNEIVPSGICIGYFDEILIVDKTKYEVFVVNVETKQTLSKFKFACYLDQRQIIDIAMDADGYLIFLDNLNKLLEVYTYSGQFIFFVFQYLTPEKITCLGGSCGRPSKYIIINKSADVSAISHFEVA